MPPTRIAHSHQQVSSGDRIVIELTPNIPTRFDPVSKKVLVKSYTESHIGSVVDTPVWVEEDRFARSSRDNVFPRRHAFIARETVLKNMKAKADASPDSSDAGAEGCSTSQRMLTTEALRDHDMTVLANAAFEAYESKWASLVYPDIIRPEDLQVPEGGRLDEDDAVPEDVEPYLSFADVPWPLFTAVKSYSELLANSHTIRTFFQHTELPKYFNGIDPSYTWELQRKLWCPSKIKARLFKRVMIEDREDVYKAYQKVREVLWEGRVGM